jgi:rSAM/selenodomain-associated transferase 1
MSDRYLIIFAKEPRMGRVKTRLARDIGTVPAWGFYRHTLNALYRRLTRDTRWTSVIAIAPDTAYARHRVWPRSVIRIPQGRGDLGQRMQRMFDLLPPGPVVIVGADIPGIEPDHIDRAFKALKGRDAVFGKADDGGYWLVGHYRCPRVPRLFQNVRWSGPHALSDTLGNLAGQDVAFLEELIDVDDGADFERWRQG